jgi:hypothetical protein
MEYTEDFGPAYKLFELGSTSYTLPAKTDPYATGSFGRAKFIAGVAQTFLIVLKQCTASAAVSVGIFFTSFTTCVCLTATF